MDTCDIGSSRCVVQSVVRSRDILEQAQILPRYADMWSGSWLINVTWSGLPSVKNKYIFGGYILIFSHLLSFEAAAAACALGSWAINFFSSKLI